MDYLARIEVGAVHAHEQALTSTAVEGLQAIEGGRGCGPPDPRQRSGVVTFTVEWNDARPVAELLNDEGIGVRSGDHCGFPLADRLAVAGTVRAGFCVCNTLDEVAHFLQALHAIALHELL